MIESEMTDMNMQESREFVVKNRPICCGQQVEAMGYEATNSYPNPIPNLSYSQFFICRGCDKRSKIQYWPLTFENMRDLKLSSILS